jgi:hypothetical protein
MAGPSFVVPASSASKESSRSERIPPTVSATHRIGTPITLRHGARVIEDSRRLRARCRLSLLSATSCSNRFVAPKARRCSIVTLFPLLSGECKPMRLDNSPEPLWLPRQVPIRVPENSALLLFGRGSRFGEWLSLGTPTGRHRALRKTSARFARRMFRRPQITGPRVVSMRDRMT